MFIPCDLVYFFKDIHLDVLGINVKSLLSSSCQFDYIEIRDGGSANAPLIGQYCGNVAPNPITTTGNAMYVRFSTDFSVVHSGFKMTYSPGEFLYGYGDIGL